MRGDGDEAMSEEADTKLLETIVKNQRKIIEKVTGRPARETPQVWALYKEVLDYYDKGMRVPDDVTILLCDDNWGNVRRVPTTEKERKRAGGWGLYYHVDYVGAPRNSKWLNVTPSQNMWEQLTLAYEYGLDRLWILKCRRPETDGISDNAVYGYGVGATFRNQRRRGNTHAALLRSTVRRRRGSRGRRDSEPRLQDERTLHAGDARCPHV